MALDFSGGIIAYSSPVPDLLGVSNITSEQIFWEKQSHGLLTDGAFGLRDIRINKILSYGKKRNISSRKSMIFGSTVSASIRRRRLIKKSRVWGGGLLKYE